MAVGNRWAAAVAMAGLAVMGPCAGQAWAQDTDTEAPAPASAAKRAGDGDRFGSAGRRAQPAVPDRAASAVRRAAPTAEIARPVRSDRAGAAVRLRPPPVVPLATAPARVVAVAAPAGVSDEESVGGAAPRATAGAVRVHRGAAVAVAAGSAQQIGAIGAAVNQFFDTLSAWLSGLPPNPFSGPVEGALLLLRRTLFNQAPTAAPVQWAQTPNDIVGTVGASDPEGDPIVYTIVTPPSRGTVTIDASGDYTYTPVVLDSADGADEFTVRLTDTGTHLNLLGPAATDIVVPIAISGVEPLLQGYTRGFEVYNLTSKTLRYSDNSRGTPDSGPPLQTLFKPGEKAQFEVTYYFFEDNIVRPVFIDDNTGDVWAVDLKVVANIQGKAVTQSCYASGSNKCKDNPFKAGLPPGGESWAYFMDPAGTTINVSGADRQKQADWLNGLCFNGGPARCTFTPDKSKSDPGGVDSLGYAGWRQLSSVSNDTDIEQKYSREITTTYSAETSWSLTSALKLTLFDKVLEASISGTYGQKWTQTESFKDTYNVTLPPGKTVYIYARSPVRKLVGDFEVKMGNTTWKLTDVEFFYPDPARSLKVDITNTQRL